MSTKRRRRQPGHHDDHTRERSVDAGSAARVAAPTAPASPDAKTIFPGDGATSTGELETAIHRDVPVEQIADARQDVGERESPDPERPHEDRGERDIQPHAERDVVERDTVSSREYQNDRKTRVRASSGNWSA